ncbi:MAG: adaptor protein MecA [Clostridia bacterium]|nr:adaptor protein MecA [Clostridia bacterium]
MKIEAISDEKILVALSDKDMDELGITYDEMDYSNIETRRVIWTILDEAKHSLGKPLDTEGKILIEVTPSDDGGCIMCFTAMPGADYKSRKKLVMKKEIEPLLFKALNEDSFLDTLKILDTKNDLYKSFHIYLYRKNIYFVIYPEISKADKIAYILSDFGDVLFGDSELLSHIFEYGEALSL